jgi:hypothetical protein
MHQNSNNPAQFDEKVETVLLHQSDFPDTQQSGLGPLLMVNNADYLGISHSRKFIKSCSTASLERIDALQMDFKLQEDQELNVLLLGLWLLVENQFPHFISMPSTEAGLLMSVGDPGNENFFTLCCKQNGTAGTKQNTRLTVQGAI